MLRHILTPGRLGFCHNIPATKEATLDTLGTLDTGTGHHGQGEGQLCWTLGCPKMHQGALINVNFFSQLCIDVSKGNP